MANPYRNEHGEYCSKDEMRSGITRLTDAGNHEEAEKLFLEYKAIEDNVAKAAAVQQQINEHAEAVKQWKKRERKRELKQMFTPGGGGIFPMGEEPPEAPWHRENREQMEAKRREREEAEQASEPGSFVDQERYRNIKKMPALFVIDREANHATAEINPSAAWLFQEESTPTIKRDGTSITVTEDGQVMARRSVKKGKQAPPGFVHAETDSFTGHQFGVEPIEQSGFNKLFQEAAAKNGGKLEPGTYELCGPKVNGNPEGLDRHSLIRHGSEVAGDIPDMRTMDPAEAYEKLREIFQGYKEDGIEGIVWWGADGKRTKLRVKDFFGDPNRR